MKTHDPFVIYERVYSDLRQVLNDAAYGNQFQKLKEAAEVSIIIIDVEKTNCSAIVLSLLFD